MSIEIVTMERIFQSWAGLASHFIGDCFDHAKPYIDNNFSEIDLLVRFVNAQLYIDCHLTSESILILIQNGKIWDADILYRSVMEGSLKYIYMLHGEPEEVLEKTKEYWYILPLISSIKRSNRAGDILRLLPNPDDLQWQPYRDLILSEHEISEIRKNYPRSQRQLLESQWSFTGILNYFTKLDKPEFKLIEGSIYGYGISSYLVHKDGNGVGMVWERMQRSEDHQTVVTMGHAARIISDICLVAQSRLYFLFKICKADTDVISKITQNYKHVLFDQLKKASDAFTELEYGHLK